MHLGLFTISILILKTFITYTKALCYKLEIWGMLWKGKSKKGMSFPIMRSKLLFWKAYSKMDVCPSESEIKFYTHLQAQIMLVLVMQRVPAG